MIADPQVDAVHINSPIHLHAPQAVAALKAGKHVACTAPAATTVDECRQIVQAAAQSGRKYMMMETAIYTREFLHIRQMRDSGQRGVSNSCAGATSRRWPGHGGSHPHLVHEFVSSIVEGRASVPDLCQSLNWTCAGICAHESAMRGGEMARLPDFGE